MLDEVTRTILDCPELQEWPGIEAILTKRKPGTGSLLKIAYESTANTAIDALPIQAAMACFVVNCILIDDVLDEDDKGAWKAIGAGRAANLAAALHARQQVLIHRSSFSDRQKQVVTFLLNQMKLLEAGAQERALQTRTDLTKYWAIVHGKSGNVCGTAMKIGAVLGEASPDQAEILYGIGKGIGEVGQISNDLRGAFDDSVNPDWRMPGSSLPILLALTTDHSHAQEFTKLLADDLGSEGKLKRAQEILVECGAVSGCCEHILQRLEGMYRGICACSLPAKEVLRKNIGEDIRHAIAWVRDLEVALPEKTTRAFDDLDAKLTSV